MSQEDQNTLKLIQGDIANMPEYDQARVKEAAAWLRATVQNAGKHGVIAMALVGAELQVAVV